MIDSLLGRLAAQQATFISFGIEVLLAVMIFLHYRRFGPTPSSSQTFGPVLPFVALTTFLVIAVVKSSFALSLGLVGALSIVRFRTPVKDPDELAYIFLAIASGIGMAADARTLTVVAVTLILIIMRFMRKTFRSPAGTVFMSVDLGGVTDTEEAFAIVSSVVREHAATSAFMRYETHHDRLHVTAALELPEPQAMPRIAGDIRRRYPASDVSFHDESHVPAP